MGFEVWNGGAFFFWNGGAGRRDWGFVGFEGMSGRRRARVLLVGFGDEWAGLFWKV